MKKIYIVTDKIKSGTNPYKVLRKYKCDTRKEAEELYEKIRNEAIQEIVEIEEVIFEEPTIKEPTITENDTGQLQLLI